MKIAEYILIIFAFWTLYMTVKIHFYEIVEVPRIWLTCSQVETCEQAEAEFKWNKKLDADGDWIPCENLCNQ